MNNQEFDDNIFAQVDLSKNRAKRLKRINFITCVNVLFVAPILSIISFQSISSIPLALLKTVIVFCIIVVLLPLTNKIIQDIPFLKSEDSEVSEMFSSLLESFAGFLVFEIGLYVPKIPYIVILIGLYILLWQVFKRKTQDFDIAIHISMALYFSVILVLLPPLLQIPCG